MADCVKALKEWTGKANTTIIYDSTVDAFTLDGLFNKVKGKRNIAVIGFTTDGDVFGGFYSVAVMELDRESHDPNIFAFSFESHGRCKTPQRFYVKEGPKKDQRALTCFHKYNASGFVEFSVSGCGSFWLGNERSRSNCQSMSRAFQGIQNTTLTGKSGSFNRGPFQRGPFHHCTRLVAIQLS